MYSTESITDLVFTAILLSIFAVLVIGPLMLIGGAVVLTRRRVGAPLALLLGIVLVGGFALTPLPRAGVAFLYFAVPPLRLPLAWIDLALSRSAREEAIRVAVDGPRGGSGGRYQLPESARGLSVHGTFEILDSECGPGAFFMTLTGFSPDPYAGFEYMPAGCEPETDPLGSGEGIAEPLGDGWFWIQAS